MYITGLSLLSLTGFAIIALIVAVRDIRTMVIQMASPSPCYVAIC